MDRYVLETLAEPLIPDGEGIWGGVFELTTRRKMAPFCWLFSDLHELKLSKVSALCLPPGSEDTSIVAGL